MIRLRVLFVVLSSFATVPAYAADLPKAFLGSWANRDGSSEFEVTGIAIGPRTYHEPGYNCTIKSIAAKNDVATNGRAPVYVIQMGCIGDGENPGRPKSVREIWALRKVNGEDVLVTAGTVGPTYPSVHILQRSGD